jgi:PhoPQ-activated pathogenicity-related protein
MKKHQRLRVLFFLFLTQVVIYSGCNHTQEVHQQSTNNSIRDYALAGKGEYSYTLYKTIPGKGYVTHVLRMVSGAWLTEKEVQNPVWWHWLRLVVPDSLNNDTALLMIGGGKREEAEPQDVNAGLVQIAQKSKCIVAHLHNVPNQPLYFVNDAYGPRSEDEIIAYGWSKFLQAGSGDEQAQWLAQLPMTRAAVRALDAVSDYASRTLKHPVEKYVVAGASKRGWTTWTTAIADERVIAIAPIVIDLLNLEPAFFHHWQAYGQWSMAIKDYVHEGVMDWVGSKEFQRLLWNVDPYCYRRQLALPKMMINAAGDEFFLPDSWQFYWNELAGEKHLRYVPNSGHSLDKTDAMETLSAFFKSVVTQTPRPDFDWRIENGAFLIKTRPQQPPQRIRLWQVDNKEARDFRIPVIGKTWTFTEIPLAENGSYWISVDRPQKGWRAFFVELTYAGNPPFILTTGVTVIPEKLPYPSFSSQAPKGTR